MNEERIAAPVSTPVWLPIETAPKDGTAILLGARGGCWIGKWLAVYNSGYRPDNPWSSLMLNHDHMGEKWQKPTHWMPLPAAPVSVQAEQPDTQGNQAVSDAAGPSAYENQTLRPVVVACEFYNRETGHAIVDYSEHTHVGHLTREKGYLKLPLVYANGPTMQQAIEAAEREKKK